MRITPPVFIVAVVLIAAAYFMSIFALADNASNGDQVSQQQATVKSLQSTVANEQMKVDSLTSTVTNLSQDHQQLCTVLSVSGDLSDTELQLMGC